MTINKFQQKKELYIFLSDSKEKFNVSNLLQEKRKQNLRLILDN